MTVSDLGVFWPSWEFLTRIPGKRAQIWGSKPKKPYYVRGYLNIVTSAIKVTSANFETFSIITIQTDGFIQTKILPPTFLHFSVESKFCLIQLILGHFWSGPHKILVTLANYQHFLITNIKSDSFKWTRIFSSTILKFIALFHFCLLTL